MLHERPRLCSGSRPSSPRDFISLPSRDGGPLLVLPSRVQEWSDGLRCFDAQERRPRDRWVLIIVVLQRAGCKVHAAGSVDLCVQIVDSADCGASDDRVEYLKRNFVVLDDVLQAQPRSVRKLPDSQAAAFCLCARLRMRS